MDVKRSRGGRGPSQHIQLVPENDNLGLKPPPRLEQRDQEVRYQPQASDHSASDYPIYPRDSARMKFPIGTGCVCSKKPARVSGL